MGGYLGSPDPPIWGMHCAPLSGPTVSETMDQGRWGAAAATAAPYAAMAAVEFFDVGLTTLAKAAMSAGMSHFIFVLYSNALATAIFFLSSFLHRRNSPPLTFPLLWRFFLLALTGITIMQNCVFTGISYSSPTLGSAMGNLVPGLTFLLAVIFRMETIHFWSSSGLAKFIGTLVCISGALIVTLCKGPVVIPPQFNSGHHHVQSQQLPSNFLPEENWAIGGLFLSSASLSLSIWNNLQAATVKRYPAEMTIVSFNSLFGTIQCAVICFIIERDPHAWKLTPDIKLTSVVYSAIFGSVVTPSIQTWCMHKKGPVFIAMFKPLGIALAAFMSSIFLGDALYIVSVLGAIIIVVGFYSVMWGKSKDETVKNIHDGDNSETSNTRKPLLLSSRHDLQGRVSGDEQ